MPIAIGIANSPVFLNSEIGGGVIPPPDAPTNLTATQDGNDVDLAWVNNEIADGIKVYRSADGVSFIEIDDIDPNDTTYTDLNPGVAQWWYYVAAYNSGGESDSNVATVGEWAAKAMGYSPTALWQLNQSSGVAVIDSSGNGYEAQATGVTWAAGEGPDGGYAVLFDGINDNINCILNGAGAANGLTVPWSSAAGTLLSWHKLFSPDQWTNGVAEYLWGIGTSGAIRQQGQKAVANNSLRFFSTGLSSGHTFSPFSEGGWFCEATTWNQAENRLRYYATGQAMVEYTYTSPQVFGTLSSFYLGANFANTAWGNSYMRDAFYKNTELSQAQIADLFTR